MKQLIFLVESIYLLTNEQSAAKNLYPTMWFFSPKCGKGSLYWLILETTP